MAEEHTGGACAATFGNRGFSCHFGNMHRIQIKRETTHSYNALPDDDCNAGGTSMKPTQSEAVFGSSPISDILYSAPLMARKLSDTNVSLAVSSCVLSSAVNFGSSKRRNAVARGAREQHRMACVRPTVAGSDAGSDGGGGGRGARTHPS